MGLKVNQKGVWEKRVQALWESIYTWSPLWHWSGLIFSWMRKFDGWPSSVEAWSCWESTWPHEEVRDKEFW